MSASNINKLGKPSTEELASLGPGCFVKVRNGCNCFWAEISQVDQGKAIGLVHQELASAECQNAVTTKYVTFAKGEIAALGCDLYCWC